VPESLRTTNGRVGIALLTSLVIVVLAVVLELPIAILPALFVPVWVSILASGRAGLAARQTVDASLRGRRAGRAGSRRRHHLRVRISDSPDDPIEEAGRHSETVGRSTRCAATSSGQASLRSE